MSCESGKVFFRGGESGKLSFSPAESLELAGPAKMPFFEPLLSQSPCCDALCLLDGTIIFPSDSTEKSVQKKGTVSDNSGEIYKKAMAEKDRTIASLSLRLNQLQKSTSDTILSLNAAIKAEQEKNAALMGELSMLKNAQRQISSYSTPEITGPTGDCTYYLTSARVIEGPEETVNSEEDSENFPEE